MSWFPQHTVESAPSGSRRFMVATQNHLGYSDAADVVALLAGTRDATETG